MGVARWCGCGFASDAHERTRSGALSERDLAEVDLWRVNELTDELSALPGFVALKYSALSRKGSRMTDQEILAKFTRILRDLLYDDFIELTQPGYRAGERPELGFFNYVNFIVAVEREVRGRV